MEFVEDMVIISKFVPEYSNYPQDLFAIFVTIGYSCSCIFYQYK